jgi:hypothetical protein
MFVALTVAEVATAAWARAAGPFTLHLGPFPILVHQTVKQFCIGVLTGSLALWLLDPFTSSATQSWLGRAARLVAWAAVPIGVVALVMPTFLPNFMTGHDAGVHQTYAFLMFRALHQGQVPARWVEGTAAGLGQPLFNYYQVGFYYLVALVHACGPGLSLSVKLTVAAAWAGGGAFMFLFCRPLGVLPATLAAAIFVWSPYILVDAYVRTAYPELTAIAFAPGILWSVDRVLRTGRPIFVCALALTTGLLLITHLPTAVIVAPVAAAYILGWVAVHRGEARLAWLVVVGVVIGVGLATFYVVPAISELSAVKIRTLTSAYFDYHNNFVRPSSWVDWSWGLGGADARQADHMSVQIGIVQWIVLAAAVAALAVPPVRRRMASSLIPVAGWLIVAGGALFMMTAASVRVWESIGPLAFIQFPWRYLILPVLACSVLAATLLSGIRHQTTQALVVLCVLSLQWYVTRDYRLVAWTRERIEVGIDDPAWASTANARRSAYREAGYDPVSVPHEGGRPANGRWTVRTGRGNVSAISEADARLRLAVVAPEPMTLVVNSPFVAGWRIAVDDRPVAPAICADSGYMEVPVPAGSHRVEAVFGKTRVRAVSDLITLISFCVWLALLGWTALAWWRAPISPGTRPFPR